MLKLLLDKGHLTTGGAFTAIAEYMVSYGCVVFLVAYDEDFDVHHTVVDNEKKLWRFRNSKYVQSRTMDAFEQVKKYLNERRQVCFESRRYIDE